MSETPEERRERLVETMVADVKEFGHPEIDYVDGALAFDALLAALEPPVADMVLRGVVEVVCEEHGAKAAWYAPRGEP